VNIAIQGWSQDSTLDAPLHVKKRLHYTVGRFASRIQGVAVVLRDLSVPGSGRGKQCQIVLILRQGGQLVVEETASTWFEVIDTAAARAWHAIARLAHQTESTHCELSPSVKLSGGRFSFAGKIAAHIEQALVNTEKAAEMRKCAGSVLDCVYAAQQAVRRSFLPEAQAVR